MGLEAGEKKNLEKIVIEVMEYENIDFILSKLIIPFAEVLGNSSVLDVYEGHEKIPFEKRDLLYQTIMRQEFADTLRDLKKRQAN